MRGHEHPRAVVVGGGPAGCSAAVRLAEAGVAVTLLEQGSPYRDKACGDALVPSSAQAVAKLLGSGTSIATLGGARFQAIEFSKASRVIWQVSFTPDDGYMVPRARLDEALRVAAARYVDVRYLTRAVDIETKGYAHIVRAVSVDEGTSEFPADVVCIAAGGTSPLSRDLRIDGDPLMAVSVSDYIEGDVTTPTFELHDSCRPGYRWSFPMSDGTNNVGVCLLGGRAGGIRAIADAFVAEVGIQIKPKWRGGKGPLWSGRGRTWHTPHGIVACGDAAGLVDPANGEGITAAIESGMRAGESLAAYLDAGMVSAHLQQYSDWVRGHFEYRYRPTPSRTAWRYLAGFNG